MKPTSFSLSFFPPVASDQIANRIAPHFFAPLIAQRCPYWPMARWFFRYYSLAPGLPKVLEEGDLDENLRVVEIANGICKVFFFSPKLSRAVPFTRFLASELIQLTLLWFKLRRSPSSLLYKILWFARLFFRAYFFGIFFLVLRITMYLSPSCFFLFTLFLFSRLFFTFESRFRRESQSFFSHFLAVDPSDRFLPVRGKPHFRAPRSFPLTYIFTAIISILSPFPFSREKDR